MSSMVDRESRFLRSAQEALSRGAWEDARRNFAQALSDRESPEALEGLGLAAWWLDDAASVFESRERAFHLYSTRGDRRGAGRVAMSLAGDTIYFRGQPAVARGWLGRARELLAGGEAVPEHGWLHVTAGDIALMVDRDPVEAGRCAEAAAAVGRALRQPDLEMVARALAGASLVAAGSVHDGMPRLDEVATAALHGEVSNPMAVGICCCYLMISCERVRDFDRAAQWCEEIRRFCERWSFNGILALCRVEYASVLTARGRWADAEDELRNAIPQLGASRPALRPEGIVRLASLRRRQGRLDEAEALLREAEGHPLVLLERAAVALDRGDAEAGLRAIERSLGRTEAAQDSDRVPGFELLVRAHLALGRTEAAAESLARLEAATGPHPTDSSRATLLAARGGVRLAERNHSAATAAFEEAIECFARAGAPFDAARTRADLARAWQASGQSERAVREASLAEAVLRELGAELEAERARALLRALGAGAPAADRPGGLTKRELEVLKLVAQGRSNAKIAAALTVSEHTVKRHVANILAKLDLPTRAAAAAHATRMGWLPGHAARRD